MATPVTILLGDISGYTRFIRFHNISLVHAEKIISELLECVIETVNPPLELKELDGDAVTFCAIQDDDVNSADEVLAQAERCMDVFRQRATEMMSEASICLCDACQRVGLLKFKMVIHRGQATFTGRARFRSIQTVDATEISQVCNFHTAARLAQQGRIVVTQSRSGRRH